MLKQKVSRKHAIANILVQICVRLNFVTLKTKLHRFPHYDVHALTDRLWQAVKFVSTESLF